MEPQSSNLPQLSLSSRVGRMASDAPGVEGAAAAAVAAAAAAAAAATAAGPPEKTEAERPEGSGGEDQAPESLPPRRREEELLDFDEELEPPKWDQGGDRGFRKYSGSYLESPGRSDFFATASFSWSSHCVYTLCV